MDGLIPCNQVSEQHRMVGTSETCSHCEISGSLDSNPCTLWWISWIPPGEERKTSRVEGLWSSPDCRWLSSSTVFDNCSNKQTGQTIANSDRDWYWLYVAGVTLAQQIWIHLSHKSHSNDLWLGLTLHVQIPHGNLPGWFTGPGFTGPGFTGPGFTGPWFTGPWFTGPGFTGPWFTGPGFTGPGFTGPWFCGTSLQSSNKHKGIDLRFHLTITTHI